MAKIVIYDFGANNGDDIPYYLLKADLVVACEANPVLADHIKQRFAAEILQGRVVVESCVVSAGETAPQVSFWVHQTNHVESQFPKPAPDRLAEYREITLPARRALDIVKAHGAPHYVKIDIEHYDHVILRDLLANNVRPPYLSAECHSVKTFALMIVAGYQAFKLVDGKSVPNRYRDAEITTAGGKQRYSFPEHSAGPFGNDIHGTWMTDDAMLRVLGFTGLGWKDIHASALDRSPPDYDLAVDVTLHFWHR